jgi:hypothetical protein
MPKSSQLGYNHNIPHKGRLFHVQTEDSGREKAHIYTHVFHAGSIIATKKVVYETDLDGEEFDAYVIGLMQESHKALIRQLRASALDERIILLLGPHPEVEAAPPSAVETAANAAASTATEAVAAVTETAAAAETPARGAPAAPTAAANMPGDMVPGQRSSNADLKTPAELNLPAAAPLIFEPTLAHPALLRLDPDRTTSLKEFGASAPGRHARRKRRVTPPRQAGHAGLADAALTLPLRDLLLASRGADESVESLDGEMRRYIDEFGTTPVYAS